MTSAYHGYIYCKVYPYHTGTLSDPSLSSEPMSLVTRTPVESEPVSVVTLITIPTLENTYEALFFGMCVCVLLSHSPILRKHFIG